MRGKIRHKIAGLSQNPDSIKHTKKVLKTYILKSPFNTF